MKYLVIALSLILILSSFASAEMMTTASPLGLGGVAISGLGYSNANVSGLSNLSTMNYGGYVGYGITNNLDAFLSVGMMNANTSGLPVGVTEWTGQSYGGSLKYTLIKESMIVPVSVAVGGSYKALSTTIKTVAGNNTVKGSEISGGIGISKIIIPFVPYAGVDYRSDTWDQSGMNTTQFNITVGTAIAWSQQGAVLVEYTSQNITPNGGTAYASNQIGASVAYAIR